jgi:hypothetical protein
MISGLSAELLLQVSARGPLEERTMQDFEKLGAFYPGEPAHHQPRRQFLPGRGALDA